MFRHKKQRQTALSYNTFTKRAQKKVNTSKEKNGKKKNGHERLNFRNISLTMGIESIHSLENLLRCTFFSAT